MYLNPVSQRTPRRDKKAILGGQCKEKEKNNRMVKNRHRLKNITDTKGTFHAKLAQ